MFEPKEPICILETHLYEDGSVDVYGISTYRHPLHHRTINEALESIKDCLNKEINLSLNFSENEDTN